MRYVIVSVVKGKGGDFNNNLRKDLFNNFKAKSSKLPAHFTIKAPFEYDGNISDLENVIKNICSNESSTNYIIDGYDHFDDRVIYMKVIMSSKAKDVHNKLIEELNTLPYIDFSETDGKDKIFHVTLSSKRIQKIFNSLWEYVNKIPCYFNCSFDNICIYKWEDNTWKLHKEFLLKSK